MAQAAFTKNLYLLIGRWLLCLVAKLGVHASSIFGHSSALTCWKFGHSEGQKWDWSSETQAYFHTNPVPMIRYELFNEMFTAGGVCTPMGCFL